MFRPACPRRCGLRWGGYCWRMRARAPSQRRRRGGLAWLWSSHETGGNYKGLARSRLAVLQVISARLFQPSFLGTAVPLIGLPLHFPSCINTSITTAITTKAASLHTYSPPCLPQLLVYFTDYSCYFHSFSNLHSDVERGVNSNG